MNEEWLALLNEEMPPLRQRGETVPCPDCGGTGEQIVCTGLSPEHGNLEQESCDRCGGTGEAEIRRHCSICRTETAGPLCDPCARRLRRDCNLIHLAIAANVCVGSGTIANLRRDEALVAEYDANHAHHNFTREELEQEAKAQLQEDTDEFKAERMKGLFEGGERCSS